MNNSRPPSPTWVLTFHIYNSIRVHSATHATDTSDHPSTIPVLCLGLLGCLSRSDGKKDSVDGWLDCLIGDPYHRCHRVGDWFSTGQSFYHWVFPLLLRCEYERMVVAQRYSHIVFGHAFSASMGVQQTKTRLISGMVITIFGWMDTTDCQTSKYPLLWSTRFEYADRMILRVA